MQLAYFPLPVFLLPGGVTKLRVFEQRYIRLVQESAGDTGFVIACPLMAFEPECDIHNWGSWVKIVDFTTGDDGLLHIDVECHKMVKLLDMTIEADGLKRGNVEVIEHWSESSRAVADQDQNLASMQLQFVYEQNPYLQELYPQPKYDCITWVVSRWLEILPLKDSEKNRFIEASAFIKAESFVQDIIKK